LVLSIIVPTLGIVSTFHKHITEKQIEERKERKDELEAQRQGAEEVERMNTNLMEADIVTDCGNPTGVEDLVA
jgi:hypothetical protein